MPKLGPGTRKKIGNAAFAAATVIDTHLVRDALGVFEATHTRYLAAQATVETHERELAAAEKALREAERAMDSALDTLVLALTMDGEPRKNPLRRFKVPSPAVLQRAAVTNKAKMIRRVAEAVQDSKRSTDNSRRAALAADTAASAIEQLVAAKAPIQITLATARVVRDVIGRQWDADLARLRLDARIAAVEGAPHLFAMLFHSVQRKSRKRVRPDKPQKP